MVTTPEELTPCPLPLHQGRRQLPLVRLQPRQQLLARHPHRLQNPLEELASWQLSHGRRVVQETQKPPRLSVESQPLLKPRDRPHPFQVPPFPQRLQKSVDRIRCRRRLKPQPLQQDRFRAAPFLQTVHGRSLATSPTPRQGPGPATIRNPPGSPGCRGGACSPPPQPACRGGGKALTAPGTGLPIALAKQHSARRMGALGGYACSMRKQRRAFHE